MLGMLKRHEVEILLKAGHSKAEVARLARVQVAGDAFSLLHEFNQPALT